MIRWKDSMLARSGGLAGICEPVKIFECENRLGIHSFGETQTELEPIQEAVATYASRCACTLRRQQSCAGGLMVFIHTNGFKANEPQYEKNFVCKLPVATSSNMELIRYALFALQAIYKEGYRYKKARTLFLILYRKTKSKVLYLIMLTVPSMP